MKKSLWLISLAAFAACNSDEALSELPESTSETFTAYAPPVADESYFPAEDKSVQLSTLDLSSALYRCVYKVGDDVGRAFDSTKATEEEADFLQTEAEAIFEGCETEKQKLDAIFNWEVNNVRYDTGGENPGQTAYNTYVNHVANCQGYSNLLNVMCHFAGLQCFNANGFVTQYWLGHAWNYVKADGKWYVVDATNNRMYLMTNTAKYKDEYFPMRVDVTLFEDESFKYTWEAGAFAVVEVKQGAERLTVPFSVENLRIFSFNPQTDLPASVREVYLGSNITSLGDGNDTGLRNHAPNVEAVHVAEGCRTFCSENGIVYRRNGSEVQLSLIPPAMRWVELSSKLTRLEKNAVYNHYGVQTLVIPASVTEIEPWAVENAPNLLWIYVPENCSYLGVDSNYNTTYNSEPTADTFVGINKVCEIIKGAVPTSIKTVRL